MYVFFNLPPRFPVVSTTLFRWTRCGVQVNPENPGLAKELVPRGVTWHGTATDMVLCCVFDSGFIMIYMIYSVVLIVFFIVFNSLFVSIVLFDRVFVVFYGVL